MATIAQILANRANARRSTGPRTPQGKARSSQNSRRYGFRSAHPESLSPADHPELTSSSTTSAWTFSPKTPPKTSAASILPPPSSSFASSPKSKS